MNNLFCNVCGNTLIEKIYEAPVGKSLTSLCIKSGHPTDVYFCHICEHVQTAEYINESEYYDFAYNILTDSDDEDQIYVVNDGQRIYRTDHQVKTLISKIEFFNGIQILDFGCAKSSTMAKLLQSHKGIEVFLYDVSSNYLPFWEKFLDPANWAVYTIPDAWHGKFDVVTSFFSLEHISNLRDVVIKIKTVLKKGGTFYAVVPNFLTNNADMIVVDHPNHFTELSLEHLLRTHGFKIENIDIESHRGALVITAKLDQQESEITNKQKLYQKAIEISNFWSASSKKINDFESKNFGLSSAIYGAGFYGAFLAANISNLRSVKHIIDQNPFLHGHTFFDLTVIPPDKLPDDIEVVYVGLNPAYAISIIEAIPSFAGRELKFFYL